MSLVVLVFRHPHVLLHRPSPLPRSVPWVWLVGGPRPGRVRQHLRCPRTARRGQATVSLVPALTRRWWPWAVLQQDGFEHDQDEDGDHRPRAVAV